MSRKQVPVRLQLPNLLHVAPHKCNALLHLLRNRHLDILIRSPRHGHHWVARKLCRRVLYHHLRSIHHRHILRARPTRRGSPIIRLSRNNIRRVISLRLKIMRLCHHRAIGQLILRLAIRRPRHLIRRCGRPINRQGYNLRLGCRCPSSVRR